MGTTRKKAGKASKRAAARKPSRTTAAKKKSKAKPAADAKRKPRRPAAARSPAKKSAPRRRPVKKSVPTPNIVVDADVLEFIAALDAFKHAHGRPFPSWSEVLHVLRGLGYRKA